MLSDAKLCTNYCEGEAMGYCIDKGGDAYISHFWYPYCLTLHQTSDKYREGYGGRN